jgi:hypothetical protein
VDSASSGPPEYAVIAPINPHRVALALAGKHMYVDMAWLGQDWLYVAAEGYIVDGQASCTRVGSASATNTATKATQLKHVHSFDSLSINQ